MFKKICFAVCVSFLLCGAPVSANEWVDMGPLDGSAEGHIWSKVVDQVGNTRGRNEIWSVELPAKAHIEFIVKCPDPYPLEVRVQWRGEYGDLFDGPIERRVDGFYQKFNNWSPEKQRDIRVVVFSRKPSTDQRYQLTVNLFGQDGKLLPKDTRSSDDGQVNLALGMPAVQSSTYAGTGVDQGAHHAVDGKTRGRDPHDLIHTNYEKNPWWRVDLGKNRSIERIKIFNRTNPGVQSNLDLELLVSKDGQSWNSVYTHNRTIFEVLDVSVGGSGRYVMARLNSERDALQLYEIEVWGR